GPIHRTYRRHRHRLGHPAGGGTVGRVALRRLHRRHDGGRRRRPDPAGPRGGHRRLRRVDLLLRRGPGGPGLLNAVRLAPHGRSRRPASQRRSGSTHPAWTAAWTGPPGPRHESAVARTDFTGGGTSPAGGPHRRLGRQRPPRVLRSHLRPGHHGRIGRTPRGGPGAARTAETCGPVRLQLRPCGAPDRQRSDDHFAPRL
ncbi:MAG: hypothetical protein AVDCRST_MAG83-504, partial [uncultured Arthrobacter sp.]